MLMLGACSCAAPFLHYLAGSLIFMLFYYSGGLRQSSPLGEVPNELEMFGGLEHM